MSFKNKLFVIQDRVKDYNTKSHSYKTIQKHVHAIAIITQNFFEH
jgi:hypothetical protein